MKNTIFFKVSILCASIGLFLVLFGFSYAWLQFSLNASKENTIIVGTLSVSLDDSTSAGINLINTLPVTDVVGSNQDGYSFTITNNGNIDSDYSVFLDDYVIDEGKTRIDHSNIRYMLINSKTGNSKVSRLSNNGMSPYRILDIDNLLPGESVTYTLKLWLDYEATNEVMGQVFSGKIRVVASQIIEGQEKKKVLALGDALAYGLVNDGTSSGGYNQLMANRLSDDFVLKNYANFSQKDLKATTLLENINSDLEIETSLGKTNIQDLIRKSDIITLSIGLNDLIANDFFDATLYSTGNVSALKAIVDIMSQNVLNVSEKIRELNNDAVIILVGQYNILQNDIVFSNYTEIFDAVYFYINDKYQNVCQSINCHFVETYTVFKNNPSLLSSDSYYPYQDGYQVLNDYIIEIIYS